MKLLLDTCTFLWIIADSAELSVECRRLFSDPGNDVYLSVASAWEICIKHGLGRLPLPKGPEQFVPEQRVAHDIASLPLEESAILRLCGLADLHKDPFDRILVCQAIAHGMILLTPDSAIRQYPAKTVW